MEKILPVGFRFNPTDEELVKDYLLKKIKGEELHCNAIKSFDVYGDLSPWEIFQRYNDNYGENKILYVFTKLKRASPYRISRVSGFGTWHEDRRMTEIYDGEEEDDDVIIGLKKTFSFKNHKNNERGEWIMNEYSLAGKYFLGKQKCDYVLCRIKKVGKSDWEAEAEPENFQGAGCVHNDHQLQFSEKNEVADNDLLLHKFDPLLQINTEEWNLSMLEKYLKDDDHEQQQLVTMEPTVADDETILYW